MSMISELIENLKRYARFSKPTNPSWSNVMSQAADTIEALSAKLEAVNGSEWIACEDRLPEEKENCLVTVKYTGFMGMYGYWIKTGHIEPGGEWWGDCIGGEVIAWQPLPEPYRCRSEDTKI